MNVLITVIVFLIIFSVLILIHECGHFFAAKRAGVKVEEFGFGLPPRLFGIKRGETLYSLNWIPFGGFVRMLGEDSTTKESKGSKRSFENQSLRAQAFIVCAGVLMNLLLAFVLLTIGFTVGIEPLISTEEDFLNEIRNGTVNVEPAPATDAEAFYLPRLVYHEDPSSVFSGLLLDGDALIQVGDQEVLSQEDLEPAFRGQDAVQLTVYRETMGEFGLAFNLPDSHPLITYIEEDSPAALAGFRLGDQILAINGSEVRLAEQVTLMSQQSEGVLLYSILRWEEELSFSVEPRAEDRRVGIAIADLLPYYGNLSLYTNYVPHTLVNIETVSYGLSAPLVALEEMGRLGKTTAVMFVSVLKEFLTGGEVPDGVSGPVGIAQMTFVTVQAGFAATLRFVALLSLSLGVINILPIPALDGGKFFFIAVQAITGRKLNAKYERLIHAGGFLFLILFILYVTFNDVIGLF